MTATFTFLWLPNAVAQHADPLDLELDHVARLQPALVTVLQDAAGPDRARAEHVAGAQLGVARGVRDDRVPRVVHVAGIAARAPLAAAGDRAGVADVLLEGVEVADGGWAAHRREEAHLCQGVLGVCPRLAAAREERLQRLGGELDHPLALDPAGPASHLVLDRREHAELHGSVCTMTSEISGRSLRIRSSISLARECASASEVPGSS